MTRLVSSFLFVRQEVETSCPTILDKWPPSFFHIPNHMYMQPDKPPFNMRRLQEVHVPVGLNSVICRSC